MTNGPGLVIMIKLRDLAGVEVLLNLRVVMVYAALGLTSPTRVIFHHCLIY